MARPTAALTLQVRERLLDRLHSGFHRPGDRFLSARAVSRQFGISYQTAHRLLRNLADEGHLVIREKSGAFVPGGPPTLTGVDLIFHPRAKRRDSFGWRLLQMLAAALNSENIHHETRWDGQRCSLHPDRLPVMWEPTHALARCIQQHRLGLLMNNRAPFGMSSLHIDSVSLDDFSGGVCAAELLQGRRSTKRRTPRRRFAILAGPEPDSRNRLRVEGFRSLLKAQVIYADGWYFEDGYRAAEAAVKAAQHGLFCCNDRLAQAVLTWCEDHQLTPPPLVGFDNAPVAEQLGIATIAIPWQALVSHAVSLIRRRLKGDTGSSNQQIICPRPIIRRSLSAGA